MSNNIINKLLKFQSQDFSSSKSLHSNTTYEVTFEAIDIAGNSLEIESEKYEFHDTDGGSDDAFDEYDDLITFVKIHFPNIKMYKYE